MCLVDRVNGIAPVLGERSPPVDTPSLGLRAAVRAAEQSCGFIVPSQAYYPYPTRTGSMSATCSLVRDRLDSELGFVVVDVVDD